MPTNTTSQIAAACSLRLASSGVVIVAHNEDTTKLRVALVAEGFRIDEVRGPYIPERLPFSASMRCLVNHANAWRIAARRDKPTIIVEADFVPVTGFGALPVPIPYERWRNSLGYLYSTGPEVWDLAGVNTARGHAGGTVALWVPPDVASLLLEFFDEELPTVPPGARCDFDTRIGYWLLRRGIESYIPYRHYGEHGGIPNPEHAVAGFGRPSQADVLQGKLRFLPMYARGKLFKYWRIRARARMWGVLRLVCGRYLAWHDFRRADPWKMIRFAAGRFLIRTP